MNEKKLQFWNERAQQGQNAGSDDFILKTLETRFISETIPAGTSVLDIGCGNGDSLIALAQHKNCTGVGVDFSPEMVKLAQAQASKLNLGSKLRFEVSSALALPADLGTFDCAYSQRCLINLDSADEQHKAFLGIMEHVRKGGFYLMVESFIDGLDRTNALRTIFNLEEMKPPWHNLFFKDSDVQRWATSAFQLKQVVPLSSTYHFLSRVVYAAVAQKTGEQLRYDSDINMLSLQLPVIGDFGPVRAYRWGKA